MTVLSFPKDVRYDPAGTFQVDTRDVLAVIDEGRSILSGDRTQFNRVAFTRHGERLKIEVISNGTTIPDNIKVLDRLGEKPAIYFGRTLSLGDANSSTLSGFFADPIRISIDPGDLGAITVYKRHASSLCEAFIGSVFTDDNKSRTVPRGTCMYYALLDIAGTKVPVAHLDRSKFDHFKAER